MHFEWFICLRYLKAKRKQAFISLISLISVAGVTVGVMALIVVLGVMTGFTEGFREKILGINSHIIVQKVGEQIKDYRQLLEQIRLRPGVVAATPYTYSQVMLSGGHGGTGVILRGIDPGTASSVLSIDQHMKDGALGDLLPAPDTKPIVPGLVIGKDLAQQLGIGMHDRVRLISAAGPLTPMGVIPKMKGFEVVGLFETGIYEYDSSLIYSSISSTQDFLNIGDSVNGIEIKIQNIFQADRIARELERDLGLAFVARDWMRTNKNLFSALQLEKTALSIIVALVVLVAAFNIVSMLIMVVMEKSRDIAILKSMGATSTSIMRIFIYEGLIIGIIGTILGNIGGLILCEILSRYQFIKLPDVYPLSTLPVKVLPLDVTLISFSAILITFLATIYPSWQAARVDPAVTLRYE